jgi:adenylate cyclase
MLSIRIQNDNQNEQVKLEDGPLTLGRVPAETGNHFVIEDRYVSRNQLSLQELPKGQLRIENHGGDLTLSDGTVISRGETVEADIPVAISVGFTRMEVAPDVTLPGEMGSHLQTIARPVRAGSGTETMSPVINMGSAPSASTLASWFETLLNVQQAAAGSAEFYLETAQAIVQLVGLDRGMVLLKSGDAWETAGAYTRLSSTEASFSTSILRKVMSEKRTFFEPISADEEAASLAQVEAVVASPIFDAEEQIVGIVYGSRDTRTGAEDQGIQPLEAQVVQILAAAVSAGLARVDKEKEAARLKVQFEEFVAPEVAEELQRNPSLLEGQDRQITSLFCDLRGYSSISEQLGPRDTYRMMGDVMDHLTNRVLEFSGVIINYAGDGMAAMWNAPTDQLNHADLACQTALAMQTEMQQLNDAWSEKAGVPLVIGIGINSGSAQVGNAGSSRRIKYGPMGHSVNLASRVEGATKYLGVPILITEHTLQELTSSVTSRRLCQVRVVGITQPVSLYELSATNPAPQWTELKGHYEKALTAFEDRDYASSSKLVDQLMASDFHRSDRPLQILSDRIQDAIDGDADEFDPVFELSGK